jgi:hypothetical protein
MKFLKEYMEDQRFKGYLEIDNPKDSDYYFNNRIASKFDK